MTEFKRLTDEEAKALTPEQAREYLACALESGEYNRTTGVLRRIKTFSLHRELGHCCLGVAEDLSPFTHWERGDNSHTDRFYAVDNTYTGDKYKDKKGFFANSGVLTQVTAKWLGMHENGLFESVTGSRNTLYSLNDMGESWENIAEVLRTRPFFPWEEDSE